MLRAMKRKRSILIPEEKKAEYEALGYRIVDMEGNPLYDPPDIEGEANSLKEENERLMRENKMLRQKVCELMTLMNHDWEPGPDLRVE